jgi:hypothetical protein
MTEIAHPIARRTVLAAGAALALLPAASHAQTPGTQSAETAKEPAAETAKGSVFEDTDGSGKRSAASKGIPGVLVSNGVEVTKTDADGNWSLPVTSGQSLFVIKPRGWALPVDAATQLPHFAYLHMPDGSPTDLDFRFAGVPPTGPLPASIDFPLTKSQEPDSFNAILFTDPQPESMAEVGYVRDDVVAQAGDVDAAFGITTGDLMFDDLSFYPRYNAIVGSIGLPWFNCPGNHDMNLEAPDNTHSRDTYKRVFGARDMAFQYGGATFIMLDNVDYLGTDPSKPNGFGKYRGFFHDGQLALIRNVLANVPTDSLVVFCFHIPLRTLAGTDSAFATVNVKDFLSAISSHTNTVSFSGHTHTSEHWYFGAAEGYAGAPEGRAGGTHHHQVLAAVSGSWWSGPFDDRGIPVTLQTDGAPNGFHVLGVEGTHYTTTFIPAHDPNRTQLRLVLDSQVHRDGPEVMKEYPIGALLAGPISRAAIPSTRLLANFFTGGPRSKLDMAVGRGAFIPMTKVERLDPFVVEVYARNMDSKKPWVNAGQSSHLWQAHLPADLRRGTHRVVVRAVDDYGRVHTGRMVLEIT